MTMYQVPSATILCGLVHLALSQQDAPVATRHDCLGGVAISFPARDWHLQQQSLGSPKMRSSPRGVLVRALSDGYTEWRCPPDDRRRLATAKPTRWPAAAALLE